MQRTIVGILIGIAFFGALVAVTIQETGVECEVCIEFKGRRACNTSSAGSRDDAIIQATSSACSGISGGVTEGIRCSNTPPATLTCTGG